MSEWKERALSEVLTFRTGKLDSNAAIENGQYPFFTCSPITLRINDYAFDENAILLAGNNANGIFSIKRYCGKFNAYQRTYVITTKEHDIDFLYYALMLQLDNFQQLSSGTATRFLTATILNSFILNLPPLLTQRAIAEVLSSLDDKIDLLTRQNATLEALAQTYFRQWFTDCEQSTPLQEVFNLVNGFAFKSSTYKMTGNYRIITIKNVQDGEITPSGATYVQEIPKGMSDKCKLSVGDVLISLTGNVGRVGIVTDENLLLNQRVAKFLPNENILLPYFYFMFRQSDMKTYLESIAKGTAQQNLSPVETLKTLIPFETDTVYGYTKIVTPLFEKIILSKRQIQILQKLRDTLLPKLISGEVKVKGR
jgi:type I restriction enzyme S subunit